MMFWTVILITGVFAFTIGLTSSQSFIYQPQDKLILKGSSLTFTCKAIGLVNPDYYWLKDGHNVTQGTTGFNSKAYLTFASVTFSNAGLYSCHASGVINDITSRQARLTVRGSPEISQPPTSISPHVGHIASFRCIVDGFPTPKISWYYNNAILTNGGRITVFGNGTLLISDVKKSEAGQYKMEAKNDLGTTLAFADLTVLDPPLVPYFITTPQNKTAKENNEVTFYCAASGSPNPLIKWLRLDGVIPRDRHSQPQPGALRLSRLVPSDDGTYACVAINTQGERRAIFYLRIEGFPRFTVFPSNKEVKENEPVSFKCAATSEPLPAIKWLLPNRKTISPQSLPSGHVRVLSNNTLVIDRVKESDGGIYKCVAENSVGSREKEAELSVLTAPRFESHQQNITKTRGQEFNNTCPARANPAPEFQWSFGGNIVARGQTLRIPALKVSDQGFYVCRVNNSMGMTSDTFFLRVLTRPNITTSPTNRTIGNGATVTFHCQSQGDPTPSVTWLKSGFLIQSNGRFSILPNGTLSVTMVTVGDQGWYTCRAENTAGRDEKKAYLVITDPPNFTELPKNNTERVGAQVVLRCRANAQDRPLITWYKVANDGSLHEVTTTVVLASGDLSFNSVGRGDRSMYVCRACNAAGCKTTPKVVLNVLYGPRFPHPPSSVGVLQGQDAVLKCEPDASPKANITWRRPNGDKMEGTGYEQTVRNVQPSKIGEYTCEASNHFGIAGPVRIKLEIQTKAVITNLLKQENSLKSTVTCKVEGKPFPKISWYLGKEQLPQNAKYPDYSVTRDSKLSVPIGSLENKTFLCNASNPQGFDVYFVKVPDVPSSLSTTEVTSHSLLVTWVQPSLPKILITHYLLEVAENTSWKVLNDTVKRSAYPVSQLAPFTSYVFRVKAANGLGTSKKWVTSQNVTTLSSNPSIPRNLILSVQNATVIKVTWLVPQILNGPLNNLEYHVIYYSKSPNFTNEKDIAHDTSTLIQEYNLVDLEPDVRYSIRVSAWRQRIDGTKLTSDEVASSATTLQLEPKTPPIGLVIVSNGPTQIIAKWKKPPYSVSGYNIWYKENKQGLNDTEVRINDGYATTYVIMDLKVNTDYQVKVQMYSNVGDGPFSKYYEVRTSKDSFLATASRGQDDNRLSWKVGVGGLVCGLFLLLIVIGIVWFWRRRSQQSTRTFRVSTKRRRTPSDIVASSVESDGTIEGHYNVAFNHELDHNLDLDMFSDDGNVIPISNSYINERAIHFLPHSQPDIDMMREVHQGTHRDIPEAVYMNVSRSGTSEGRNNGIASAVVTVNSNKNYETGDPSESDATGTKGIAPIENDQIMPDDGIPVYTEVDKSKKANRKSSKENEIEDGIPVYTQAESKKTNRKSSKESDLGDGIPVYTQVDKSKKTKRKSSKESDLGDGIPVYTQIDKSKKTNRQSSKESDLGDGIPVYTQIDKSKKTNRKSSKESDLGDGIPVYTQIDMAKNTNRKSSKESDPDDGIPVYRTRKPSSKSDLESENEEHYDEDDDIFEVPYPDEDLPRMERTWTNVSEFNFPPPPTFPPPDDHEAPNTNGPDLEPTNNDPIPSVDPVEELQITDTSDEDPPVPKDKGTGKRRMVASWAEDDEEPMGNLWEAVDKELDRRLGTT